MYIGKPPTVGNFQACDAISVVNGQAAYTLQVGGTNVAPESAQHCLVSLNGVLQAPISSYTISGSTLTFAANLATGDSIDFITILGDVLDIGAPSDDTVTAAKLNNDIISGTTALTAEPADTDEFLVSDAGTLKRIDYSLIKGKITEADQFRVSATTSTPASTVGDLTANWERVDTDGFGKVGTGLTESSGIFSFASTGTYYIHAFACFQGADSTYYNLVLKTTTDNSSYGLASENYCFTNADAAYQSTSLTFMFNVTNTTTHKLKFGHRAASSGGSLQGQSAANANAFTFIRLGDST